MVKSGGAVKGNFFDITGKGAKFICQGVREGGGAGKALDDKMDEKIRRLYVRMVQEEFHTEKISKKTREEVSSFLEEQGQEQSREELLDTVLLAVCAAEENGFVMGFKYAFRLFLECIQE